VSGRRIVNTGLHVAGGQVNATNIAVGPGATINTGTGASGAAGPDAPAGGAGAPQEVTGGPRSEPPQEIDVFVSYAAEDTAWAEWVGWQLEEEGFRVRLRAWDEVAGGHRTRWLHQALQDAAHVLAVLSRAYLGSVWSAAEWEAAWSADPTGLERRLLLARVENCEQPGLLRDVVPVDLFGREATEARRELLAGLAGTRRKPERPPPYPGGQTAPRFPGA
jgi:hypothetical protein